MTVAIPGTPVRIPVLTGFEPAEAFPGFIDPETSSSLMAQVMPVPWDQLQVGFDRESLLKQGLSLMNDEAVTVDGRSARLLHCTQAAVGVDFDKWILIWDADGRTVLLVATFPVMESPAVSQRLRDTMLAATLAEHTPEPPPRFTLGETPALRHAAVWSGMSLFTPDGEFVPGEPGEALFIAGYSAAAIVDPEARRRFAIERIGSVDHDLMGVTVTALRDVSVAGLDGWEVQAVGTSRTCGEKRALYMMLLFEPERYVIMTGVAGETNASVYVPAFQIMASGYRPD